MNSLFKYYISNRCVTIRPEFEVFDSAATKSCHHSGKCGSPITQLLFVVTLIDILFPHEYLQPDRCFGRLAPHYSKCMPDKKVVNLIDKVKVILH